MKDKTFRRAWDNAEHSGCRRKAKRLAHALIRVARPYMHLRVTTAASSRRAALKAALIHAAV